VLSGAKKGAAKKMQVGGLSAVPAPPQPGMGTGAPSGGMGVSAPGAMYQPGHGPNLRIGY
jgi:hypothetical protein